MNRFVRLVQLIGVNSVPLWGATHGWSPATLLVIYWFENFLGGLLVAARIAIHRRTTRKQGHFVVEEVRHGRKMFVTGSFLRHFAVLALGFTAAHGFFLAIVLLIATSNGRIHWTEGGRELSTALLSTTFFLLLGFVADLPGVASRPFGWIRSMRNFALGRTFVIHLTIVIGMIAAGVTNRPAAFFIVFVAFKFLLDAGSLIRTSDPLGPPPDWLADAMRRQEAGERLEDHESYWASRWRVDSAAAHEAEKTVP